MAKWSWLKWGSAGAVPAAGVGLGAVGAVTGKKGILQDGATNALEVAQTAAAEAGVEASFHTFYKILEKLGELFNRVTGTNGGDALIRWSQDAMGTNASDTLAGGTASNNNDNNRGPGDNTPAPGQEASLNSGMLGLAAAGLGVASVKGLDVARTASLDGGTNDMGRGKLGKLFTVAGIGAAGIGGLAYATSEAKADEPGNTDLAGTNLEQFTKSEINLQGDFGEASFAGEALHKGHVLAHGVQDGLAGLVGSPEDLYDMVDGWTNGWLPGDHNTNSTYNFATEVADDYLISKPEIRSEWDAAVHATGGLASWLIPVGGALKAAGAGAKMVNGARAFETAENIVGGQQIGQAVTMKAQQFLMN